MNKKLTSWSLAVVTVLAVCFIAGCRLLTVN